MDDVRINEGESKKKYFLQKIISVGISFSNCINHDIIPLDVARYISKGLCTDIRKRIHWKETTHITAKKDTLHFN